MPRKTTITVVERPKVVTIESQVSVKDVEKAQMKVIENSDAWKEHQKQHANARLHMMSDKKEGEFEKLLGKKEEKVSDEQVNPKKAEDVIAKAVTYGRGNASEEKKGNPYFGGHDHGTIMASCDCGQTFKSQDGNTSTYKLKSEEAVQAISGNRYQKKEEESVRGYKRGQEPEEETPRTYGRR